MLNKNDVPQDLQLKGVPNMINYVNAKKKYIPFDKSYKGNMTSREAGLMVRDMVEAYENKLK